MSSRFDIAKKVLTTVNPLQRFLSTQKSDEEPVWSPFMNDDFPKFSRHVKYDQRMELSSNNGEEFSFKIPVTPHFLIGCDLIQELPTVTLKEEYQEEYQISYVPKTGLYILEAGQIYQGEEPVGSNLTGDSLDQIIEFLGERYFKQSYETIIDSIQGDTNWGLKVEGKSLIIPQSFFYCGTLLRAFKKSLMTDSSFSQRYNLRRNLASLLRLRKKDNDGFWILCSTEDICAMCEFSDKTAEDTLKASPELWGSFAVGNLREQTDWKDKRDKKQRYLDSFQELVQISCPTIKGSGVLEVDITRQGCVRGIFWSLRNIAESKVNNFYTFDDKNKDPITKTSLIYSADGYEWKDFSSFHHSRRLPPKANARIPRAVGYHYHPIVFDALLTDGADTHIDLKAMDSKLVITYKVTGEFQPLIFLDMHRVSSYMEGKLVIHSVTDPEAKKEIEDS